MYSYLKLVIFLLISCISTPLFSMSPAEIRDQRARLLAMPEREGREEAEQLAIIHKMEASEKQNSLKVNEELDALMKMLNEEQEKKASLEESLEKEARLEEAKKKKERQQAREELQKEIQERQPNIDVTNPPSLRIRFVAAGTSQTTPSEDRKKNEEENIFKSWVSSVKSFFSNGIDGNKVGGNKDNMGTLPSNKEQRSFLEKTALAGSQHNIEDVDEDTLIQIALQESKDEYEQRNLENRKRWEEERILRAEQDIDFQKSLEKNQATEKDVSY